MPESAWCSQCNEWVSVSENGGCANGHPRSSLRGLRQGPPPMPGGPQPVRVAAPPAPPAPTPRAEVDVFSATPDTARSVSASSYPNADGYALVGPEWTPDLTDLMLGQKSLIYGIILNLVSTALRLAFSAISGPQAFFTFAGPMFIVLGALGLASAVCSIYGIWRIGRSLGYSDFIRAFYLVSMFVPFFSLIVMLVLNAQATSKLRKGGYTVGLLGASA